MFYFGVVEDRLDPLRLGRCRVRVVGVHTASKVDLPTSDLPWAIPMTPITSASVSGIGHAAVGPVEGTYVIIFFRDEDKQQLVMLGTIPGFPIESESDIEYFSKLASITNSTPELISVPSDATNDVVKEPQADDFNGFKDPSGKYPTIVDEPDTNRLARRQKINSTVVRTKTDSRLTDIPVPNTKDSTWDQPNIPYNAKYPFNHVWQSESGHLLEFDDTEGSERINLHHKIGTFTEIDHNGTRVSKIVGSNYEIIDHDGYVFIRGNCIVNVMQDVALQAQGNVHILSGKKINIGSNDNISIQTKKDLSIKVDGSLNISIGKDYNVASQTHSLKTNRIDWKYTHLAADGLTFFNSGQANPNPPDIKWGGFEGSLSELPVNSMENDETFSLEGMTAEEMKAAGFPASEIKEAEAAKTAPQQEKKQEAEIETSKETPVPVDCSDLPDNYKISTQISKYAKISTFMTATAGGDIIGQNGLTRNNVGCNLVYLAKNAYDPIKERYPNSTLTSGFRRNGSVAGSKDTSDHNKGGAFDIQFSDCKTQADYYYRAQEVIKLLPGFKQVILETNTKGTSWLHISSMKGLNKNNVLTMYKGTYHNGLILFGSSSSFTITAKYEKNVVYVSTKNAPQLLTYLYYVNTGGGEKLISESSSPKFGFGGNFDYIKIVAHSADKRAETIVKKGA
jgi:hypothetical protein